MKQYSYILIFIIPFLLIENRVPFGSFISYGLIILYTIINYGHFRFINKTGLVNGVMTISSFALLRMYQSTEFLIKDIGLMIIGVLPFLCNCDIKIPIKKLNLFVVIGFLLTFLTQFSNLHINLQSLISSDIGIEAYYCAFIFPLFSIYWLLNRDYKLAAINFLFAIIAGKRIAMIGVIVSIFISYLNRDKEGVIDKRLVLLFMGFVCLFVYISVLFAFGYFDKIIYDCTGVTADYITMGRETLYSNVVDENMPIELWGVGPGNTIPMIEYLGITTRLHNDIFKIYVENGIFLFLAFFYMFFKGASYHQLPFLIYILIIFLTDNTLIYSPIMLYYCLFINSKDCLVYRRKVKNRNM